MLPKGYVRILPGGVLAPASSWGEPAPTVETRSTVGAGSAREEAATAYITPIDKRHIESRLGVCDDGAIPVEQSGASMNFHTRKWVKPEDLNPNGTLFGGSLLRWIDEEAAIYAIVQLGNQRVVTKYISEINFVSASRQGDIIELGITASEFGRTSITLTCEVRNKITRKSILTVDKLVFVNLGEDGLPAPHGRTEIRYIKDQFEQSE
jgi:acyl-CoA hydrolase